MTFRAITRRLFSTRKGFGSFHSEDVEVLVRQSDTDYQIPDIIHEFNDKITTQFESFSSDQPIKDLFPIDKSWTFLNHGAFGCSPVMLLNEATSWRFICESQPLIFFDRMLLPCIAHSVRKISQYLGCPATEIIPLSNVTTGMNCAVNSFIEQLKPGDDIICLSLTYGSTKKLLKHAAVRACCNLITVDIRLPIQSSEAVIALFEEKLSDRTRLVVLDQTTSNTALLLPVLEMGRIAKARGAYVIIDAAHALFSQPVSIYGVNDESSLTTSSSSSSNLHPYGIPVTPPTLSSSCDIWLTNCHKWLGAPKGGAFMWVSPRVADRLRPGVISHGFTPGRRSVGQSSITEGGSKEGDDLPFADPNRLLSSFVWDGCRDYASILTTSSALLFWHLFPVNLLPQSAPSSPSTPLLSSSSSSSSSSPSPLPSSSSSAVGADGVRRYNQRLLEQATAALEQAWSVDCERQVAPASLTLRSPMRLVRADNYRDLVLCIVGNIAYCIYLLQ